MSGGSDETRAGGVVLVGFMGAGKSTVGQLLADRLGIPFRDVDLEVVQRAGKSVAHIFEAEGEDRFRLLERAAIARLVAEGPAVISTGGGALGDAANRDALASFGVWVWLTVRPDTVWERVRGTESRPLLRAAPDEARRRIERLIEARTPLYAMAAIHVGTDGRAPTQVADAVRERLGGETRTLDGIPSQPYGPGDDDSSRARPVTVSLGSRAYPVYVGRNCLTDIGDRLAQVDVGRQGLLVTNPTVEGLFGDAVTESLARAGFQVKVATMPDGERHKRLDSVERLYDQALEAGLDRKGFVIALGGGVVGDTAGFLAATYMRGIPFIQLPTTLLAQVDASVGGKVGVNHPHGKNLIGAFHQPRLVMADVSTLDSLPDREWRSGMAEVIKEGLMADRSLFEYVEARGTERGAWDLEERAHAVRRSVEIKADVVAADERETGRRALLNLGHTVGHAVESLTHYDHERITHGEGVALGMLTACLVSEQLTGFARSDTERIRAFLAASGYPVWLGGIEMSDVMDTLRHDKKVVDGRITMALLSRIGEAVLHRNVPKAVIEAALREQISWGERGASA